MSRVSGKLLEFWLSADETAPTSTDKVAYVRQSGSNINTPITNVTASGDPWQEHVDGISGATFSVSGVLDKTNPSGKFQFEDALNQRRHVAMVPVGGSGEEDDKVSGIAIISSLQWQGSYDGTWTFNAQLTLTGAPAFAHAGP